jgi:PilZ domain-containing protein
MQSRRREALLDPRIYAAPTQPDFAPDSNSGDEGVDYLRRLKGAVVEAAPADAVARGGGEAPAAANNFAWKERRQSPRLRCSGSAEFRVEGNDVRMWGTVTDVSLHGCYVEMNTTFPAGTKVALVLKSFGIGIETPGTVRASYPFLGMGICFAEIEPIQQMQMKQLLAALAGRSAVSDRISAEENSVKDILASADPKPCFDGIAEFFQKNQLPSRNEFHQIAKRARRS